MIFYHPKAQRDLQDFGIKIPLLSLRIEQVRLHLLQKFGPPCLTELTQTDQTLGREDLARVHTPEYVEKLFLSRTGLEQALLECYECLRPDGGPTVRYDPSQAKTSLLELFQDLLAEGYGTYKAIEHVLQKKAQKPDSFAWSFFLGGGMHHARPNGPGGFCLFHDIVVGLARVKETQRLSSAWVIDVDAHMGDGTAFFSKIFPWLKSLSIHMENGWPLGVPDQDGARPHIIPSTLDIPVSYQDSRKYLALLRAGLEQFKRQEILPDVAVVVLGADPFLGDVLQSTRHLQLTKAEMLARDQFLFNFFKELQIPVAYVMGGGYGPHIAPIYEQFLDFALLS
ncbi:MAG: hypothetical protein A2X86_00590 [Bdellovibrionales bacterium GWA2_49_15]|nr:MAG: hypothetical protein A2X86_00590 [Bdellovibrionales bacterium GWA2_49_15]HAZ13238.1 hypothetical protein [Bdellovibrionales bacterium]